MLALCLACSTALAAAPAQKSAEPAEARARTLATQAKELFDAGQFLEAAKTLEAAVALTPTPALLYNLGRAYQQAGQNEAAIGAYRRYLAAAPQAANARAVEETVASLQKQLDARAGLEQQLAAERERAEARERELAQARTRPGASLAAPPKKASPVPWVVAAVGLAATGVGAAFGVLALGQHQAAVSALGADAAYASQKSALTYAAIANTLFIAGPVVALAGVIWGVFERRTARATPLALTFTGRGLALSGAWP